MQPCVGSLGPFIPFPGLVLPTLHFSLSVTVSSIDYSTNSPPSPSPVPILNQLQVLPAQLVQDGLIPQDDWYKSVLKVLYLLPELLLCPAVHRFHELLQLFNREVF